MDCCLEEVTHSTFGTLTSLSSLEASNTSEVVSVERDENGRIARVVTGSSDVSYMYDTAGQLASLTDNTTGETSTYAYDVCGRITAMTTSEGTTSLTYNTAGELTSRVLPGGMVVTYVYDGCGRRVSETVNGELAAQYEWDSLGYLARLTRRDVSSLSWGTGEVSDEEVDSFADSVFLTHDVFGNLASVITAGGKTTQFLWDINNSVPSLLTVGGTDVFTVLGHTALGTPQTNLT